MAKVLFTAINVDADGDDLVFDVRLMFVGRDVSPPDFTQISVRIPDGTGVTNAKTLIRNAIAAEATRAGHVWNGKAFTIHELFQGLST